MNQKNILKNIIAKQGTATEVDTITDAEIDEMFGTAAGTSTNAQDYVIEHGTSGNWRYKKFSSGQSEAWYTGTVSISTNTAWGSMYFSGDPTQISIPTGIFNSRPTVNINVGNNSYMLGASTLTGTSANNVSFYIYNSRQISTNFTIYVDIHCSGTWK